MSEIERIAKQIEKTFTGRAWHGPAVEEVLAGVTADIASARPPGSDHTVWQLVDHMAFWQDTVRRWLAGERHRPQDQDSWSAPSEASEAAWQSSLARLRSGNQALLAQVKSLDESRLSERLFEDMPSLYAVLHGVAQHNVYHAGQIAIMKKQATDRRLKDRG
jgi:hypothetical protein